MFRSRTPKYLHLRTCFYSFFLLLVIYGHIYDLRTYGTCTYSIIVTICACFCNFHFASINQANRHIYVRKENKIWRSTRFHVQYVCQYIKVMCHTQHVFCIKNEFSMIIHLSIINQTNYDILMSIKEKQTPDHPSSCSVCVSALKGHM